MAMLSSDSPANEPTTIDTNELSLAAENALLQQQAAERAMELESLLGVARAVTSTLELDELVRLILSELQNVVDYSAASLILVEDGSLVVHDLVTRGKIHGSANLGVRFPLDKLAESHREIDAHPTTLDYPCVQVAASPEFWRRIDRGETVVIPDVLSTTGELAEDYRKTMGELIFAPEFEFMRSWMAIPLLAKGEVLGYIGVASDEPEFFTTKHLRLGRAFADHVSLAIQNARLYEGAQKLAAVEERQRLARDLHDSVAQALYGIALGARTARRYLDTNTNIEAVSEPIDYVVSLAAAGLAEMRALIFDLHPESLENEGLNKAIERQVNAIQARYEIKVDWERAEEPAIPLAMKEALYSVLRESLHNIVKHAQATNVQLNFHQGEGLVRFSVADDGLGFDLESVPPGHLGLRSMKERIDSLGGEISITTESGQGTRVSGVLPTN